MSEISIMETGALFSRGTLASKKKPVTNYFVNQNGPSWPATVPPGNYIFSCDLGGKGGATVTITVTDKNSPGQPLASSNLKIPGSSSTLNAATAQVVFKVT